MDQLEIFKALSNKRRLQILNWLKDPEKHFPDQKPFGYENGVCVGIIQQKCGLTQSTISDYLALLQRAGLVEATRVGQWTCYRRNEAAFTALSEIIKSEL
jgi:DNA-binding transcriptional ArsR family regulator